jgi:hypothetical protein
VSEIRIKATELRDLSLMVVTQLTDARPQPFETFLSSASGLASRVARSATQAEALDRHEELCCALDASEARKGGMNHG